MHPDMLLIGMTSSYLNNSRILSSSSPDSFYSTQQNIRVVFLQIILSAIEPSIFLKLYNQQNKFSRVKFLLKR